MHSGSRRPREGRGQQSDSSEFRFTVSKRAGHPEGEEAGQSWGLIWASEGPLSGLPGPLMVSSWTDLGAPSIFLPQDPGPVAGAIEPRNFWAGGALAL